MNFNFNRSEKGLRELAIFVSQLIKEGVVFTTKEINEETFVITLVGGF